jgi:hypothetical protein
MDHATSLKSIRLMAREVLPALREYAKELQLFSPFETSSGAGYSRSLMKAPEALVSAV